MRVYRNVASCSTQPAGPPVDNMARGHRRRRKGDQEARRPGDRHRMDIGCARWRLCRPGWRRGDRPRPDVPFGSVRRTVSELALRHDGADHQAVCAPPGRARSPPPTAATTSAGGLTSAAEAGTASETSARSAGTKSTTRRGYVRRVDIFKDARGRRSCRGMCPGAGSERPWGRQPSGMEVRMFVVGTQGILALVALLLVAVPAYAQRDADRQRPGVQLSDELASCDAYCLIISRCLGGPRSAQDPANSSLAQQYADQSKTLRRLAFLFSESAGRADAATSAFIDRVTRNAMQRIRQSCANVTTVVDEHGQECQQLAEHPDDRLETLLNQTP